MFKNLFVAVKMFILFQKIIFLFLIPMLEILERNKRDIRYSIKKTGKDNIPVKCFNISKKMINIKNNSF